MRGLVISVVVVVGLGAPLAEAATCVPPGPRLPGVGQSDFDRTVEDLERQRFEDCVSRELAAQQTMAPQVTARPMPVGPYGAPASTVYVPAEMTLPVVGETATSSFRGWSAGDVLKGLACVAGVGMWVAGAMSRRRRG